MKGRESNIFNKTSLICSLAVQLFQTDETFTVDVNTHIHGTNKLIGRENQLTDSFMVGTLVANNVLI